MWSPVRAVHPRHQTLSPNILSRIQTLNLNHFFGRVLSVMDAQDETEAFREQCHRQMARPLEARMKYGFCRVYRPVLDDAPVRVFDTTKEYREWCAENLPAYLGFQPAVDETE
jgi:hypothetical protein